jgi:hypothetical protein
MSRSPASVAGLRFSDREYGSKWNEPRLAAQRFAASALAERAALTSDVHGVLTPTRFKGGSQAFMTRLFTTFSVAPDGLIHTTIESRDSIHSPATSPSHVEQYS